MSLRSSARARVLARRAAIVAALFCGTTAAAQEMKSGSLPEQGASALERYVAEMWSGADADWKQRLQQDETQAQCSRFRNNPPDDIAEAIRKREAATIALPEDGNVLGRWQDGEKIAQNGRGGQFSDAPDTVRGGNCYACHEMAKSEASFGTLGPSLAEYGKLRGFSAEAAKETFAKIYNSQATLPCSSMPRFGVHGFLTAQQIKDVTAYLFDRESPVNK